MEAYRLTRAIDGRWRVKVPVRGHALLSHSMFNKGTAFTLEERAALGLEGLLPREVNPIEVQLERVYQNITRKPEPLERYVGLAALHDRNEVLFYRLLLEHTEEMLPIVYTPTVGLACQRYSHIFRRARGLWITPEDKGRIEQVLGNAPFDDVRLIVVTDNERILGLGDQGAGGMGIPVGKLALYTVAAGIHPTQTLPISLDVGTDNQALLDDPLYLGWRRRRLRGREYDAFVEEFVQAVQRRFPRALLQWEDFKKANAFRLLDRYRTTLPSFNDDIQGTAGVTLAAFYAGARATGVRPQEHRFVILGAGAAGIGIAWQLRAALERDGLSGEALTRAIILTDSKGLLVDDGKVDEEHKKPFAWPVPMVEALGLMNRREDLVAIIEAVKPTVLIGTTGTPGMFDERVVRTMAQHAARPMIFPLSNPTDLAEGKPAEIIPWSEGRALVATGSPFQPVPHDGRTHVVSQANNAYVFPGLGLGVLVAQAREVTDAMFTVAAKALAELVTPDDLARGALLPPVDALRRVSRAVAIAVVQEALSTGLARRPLEAEDVAAAVDDAMWYPDYPVYEPA
ncbi:MAG: NAD-dependent malic enzyme [Planctomycetota bacterium]|nr:NAD-dependent malic enzyme [Planctomycetota bacterium]